MTLYTSPLQEHLTTPNADLSRAAAQSYPGMAHFAGTGPHGETCRGCVFWGAVFNPSRHFDYFAKGGGKGGGIKPHTCEKYRRLMSGTIGAKIPADAPSCKYFERNETPPTRYSK